MPFEYDSKPADWKRSQFLNGRVTRTEPSRLPAPASQPTPGDAAAQFLTTLRSSPSPVILGLGALRVWLAQQHAAGQWSNPFVWEGAVGDLHKILKLITPAEIQGREGWPADATKLGQWMRAARIELVLHFIGANFETRRIGPRRTIRRVTVTFYQPTV